MLRKSIKFIFVLMATALFLTPAWGSTPDATDVEDQALTFFRNHEVAETYVWIEFLENQSVLARGGGSGGGSSSDHGGFSGGFGNNNGAHGNAIIRQNTEQQNRHQNEHQYQHQKTTEKQNQHQHQYKYQHREGIRGTELVLYP